MPDMEILMDINMDIMNKVYMLDMVITMDLDSTLDQIVSKDKVSRLDMRIPTDMSKDSILDQFLSLEKDRQKEDMVMTMDINMVV